MLALVALGVVAFLASVVASVTGGTSLVTVPAMLMFGMSPTRAIGTNMLALVGLSSGATARFLREGSIPRHPTLGLLLISTPASFVGASVAIALPDAVLRITVAVAVMVMGLVVFAPRGAPSGRERQSPWWAYALMGLWAMYGGLFSGGYATVLTLACVALFGLPMLRAVAVAKLVNLAGSAAAASVFIADSQVDWGVAAVMGVAGVLGGWVGAHLALRWGAEPVRRLMLVVVTGLGVRLVYDAWRVSREVTSYVSPATVSTDAALEP